MTSSSSSAQHMDFDAKVEYWSSEQHHHHHQQQQQQGHRFKCSQMEVHPSKPLVLSVDQRDGSLCLWDIQLKKALIDAVSVYALFADSLNKRAPPSASSSTTTTMLRPSPFHLQSQLILKHDNDDGPRDIYRRKTTSVKLLHNTTGSEAAGSTSSNVISAAKAKQYMGNVIQFGFADLSSVLYANGFNNSSSSCRDLAARQHLRCSDSLIFLVCEHVVLLYDYFTKQTRCVTMTDSMRKQMVSSSSSSTMASALSSSSTNTFISTTAQQPTSTEQIYCNTCAVGGSDGSIRLWELSTASVLMTLTMTISVSFSKSAIVAIKSVPKKRYVQPSMYCTYNPPCTVRTTLHVLYVLRRHDSPILDACMTHPFSMHACLHVLRDFSSTSATKSTAAIRFVTIGTVLYSSSLYVQYSTARTQQ